MTSHPVEPSTVALDANAVVTVEGLTERTPVSVLTAHAEGPYVRHTRHTYNLGYDDRRSNQRRGKITHGLSSLNEKRCSLLINYLRLLLVYNLRGLLINNLWLLLIDHLWLLLINNLRLLLIRNWWLLVLLRILLLLILLHGYLLLWVINGRRLLWILLLRRVALLRLRILLLIVHFKIINCEILV